MALTIGIVHDYAELTLLRLVNLFEADNIRMVENFKDFSFAESRLLIIFTHFLNVNLLDYSVRLKKKNQKMRVLEEKRKFAQRSLKDII